MIDFHSHILPAMDDGSKSVRETKSLLEKLAAQGVTRVAATPHFHADMETVDMFLERRRISEESLSDLDLSGLPIVAPGAEIRYYQGISRLDGLEKLCIKGSQLLLIEMPFMKWSDYALRELAELAISYDVQPVLAHIERYLKYQKKETWEYLLQEQLLMQSNATFFTQVGTRRKAFQLLKNQTIHFLGSDCHNLSDRAPCIGQAMTQIRKKMGVDFADHMIAFGERWFA